MTTVAGHGFHVAEPVPTIDGALTCERIIVQRWVGGHKPSSPQDWALVADELRRLHDLARDVGQRPGCCVVAELADRRTSVDADLDRVPADVAALVTGVFADFEDVRTAVVHGDPAGSNVRVDDGLVWLLDSDESRVDLVWHDLSNLGVAVLDPIAHARAQRLSDAWEAINAWQVEPEYARMRLQRLRGAPSG